MVDYRENARSLMKGTPDLRHYLLESIGAAAQYGLNQIELYINNKDRDRVMGLLDEWNFEFDISGNVFWIYWGD